MSRAIAEEASTAVPDDEAAAEAGLSKLAGKSIPVRISRTLDDPKISADLTAMIASRVESAILDRIGLGKKREPAEPSADAEATLTDEATAEEEAAEEEDEKSLKDQLKDKALKRIFGR